MKHVLLLLPALLAALAGCTQTNSYSGDPGRGHAAPERPKTPEELRAELLAQEQAAPTDYLHVVGSYRRNLVDQLVLEGDIANQATLASYKDPLLAVTWFSKTGTELDTKQYPIYELVRAQQSKHIKLKTNAPDYVASVSIGIAGATAVE